MPSKPEIEREQERARGILSGSDRKWLLMPKDEYVEEHSRQYWGQRRDEITDRVQNAMLDFTLLFDHLPFEVLCTIVGQRPTAQMQFEDSAFDAGVRDALAFTLEGAGGARLLDEDRPEETTARRLLRDAFERIAWKYEHSLTDFHLEVGAERIPRRDLIESLESGDELSSSELAQLLIASDEEIDTTLLQEQMRSQLITETGNDE